MAAYYNDNDPFVAQWLRNLIANRLIAPGEVDERDIRDVQPGDLAGYTQCHFFAGIGGWSHALRLAGWPDIRPVWTGSCPCQPFSAIGERTGSNDERHLWPEFFRLIRECQPDIIFGEQVASDDGLAWLDGVFTDLEGADYAVGAGDLSAAGVGAPHIRQRLYWMGHALGAGLEGYAGHGYPAGETQTPRPDATAGGSGIESAGLDALPVLRRMDVRDPRGARSRLPLSADRGMGHGPLWSEFEALACSDGWRRVQPGTFPMAHGLPARVGRLRAYGNAIVPQVAAQFIRAMTI